MEKKAISVIILTILPLVSMLTFSFNIQPVKSDWTWTGTVTIKANGSVDPKNAPISSADNVTYTLTDNIVDVPYSETAVSIEKDNIVVNGAGHTLQGTGAAYSYGIHVDNRSNVTIKNMTITGFWNGIGLEACAHNNNIIGNNIKNNGRSGGDISGGIYFCASTNNYVYGNNIRNNTGYGGIWIEADGSNYNSIVRNNITNNLRGIKLGGSTTAAGCNNNNVSGNNIKNNNDGIELFENSNDNSIAGNNIKNNTVGIRVRGASNNKIFHNNFVDNTKQVYNATPSYANIWDNGSEGNYWSDYKGTDTSSPPDGIGDTPYTIDKNNQDNYPLMNCYWNPAYRYWNPADINRDLKVNMDDKDLAAKAYGSYPGQPNWNPHADITGRNYLVPDGKVDIRDISLIVANLGKEYP